MPPPSSNCATSYPARTALTHARSIHTYPYPTQPIIQSLEPPQHHAFSQRDAAPFSRKCASTDPRHISPTAKPTVPRWCAVTIYSDSSHLGPSQDNANFSSILQQQNYITASLIIQQDKCLIMILLSVGHSIRSFEHIIESKIEHAKDKLLFGAIYIRSVQRIHVSNQTMFWLHVSFANPDMLCTSEVVCMQWRKLPIWMS